jgi:flagellar hook-associated protein FlgK
MSLFIGLSALRASQTGLDVISQNIANANTPGYHRQNVHLESLNDNLFRGRRIGSGVSILNLERVRYAVIESFLTETTSDSQHASQRLLIETQIENAFLPGDGSLQEVLNTLFENISSLSSAPSDNTSRQQVVQSGVRLASQFRELASNLQQIKQAVLSQLQTEVTELNGQIRDLSRLNQEIISATAVGGPPNGLLDIRDELINSIAAKLDVSRVESTDGTISLSFGNYSIQRSITEIEFALVQPDNGPVSFALGPERQALQITSGRIAALIESYNEIVPQYENRLNELAATLIERFDRVHATGVGLDGPFERLVANRPVPFPNTPLSQSGAAFAINAGELYISIVAPNGTRRTEVVPIDPQNDSLADVAARITALGNLSASINSQTTQLQIVAAPGYRFDFTGAVETVPDLSLFNGSSTPSFSGRYSGTENTQFRFEIVGSGDVGVSQNLSLRVTDADGNLIGNFNIGNGYEAGKTISVAQGLEIKFPPGSVLSGDSFTTELVAIPDETNLLASIGLNSFFQGRDALSIAVDPQIAADSRRFASSLTGDSADAAKVLQFIELGRAGTLSNGRLSFSEYLIEVSAEVGVNVQSGQRLAENLDALLIQYQQERDSISAVDVNEEFVRLTQFQRSYEAAVRVIQTAESILDELFSIFR